MPRAPGTPPPLPPRKPAAQQQNLSPDPQSLSYFVPPPPPGWAVVGAYSASELHSASALLAKRDIIARMGNAVDETGRAIELLVPAGNQAYAKALLAGGIHRVAKISKVPRGFPLSIEPEPPPEPAAIPFAEPVRPGLSPRQILLYNLMLVALWLLLIFVLLLIAIPIATGLVQ